MWREHLFSTLLLISSLVTADWINPPAFGKAGNYSQNNVYSIGSTILLEWDTSYEVVNLRINQDVARGDTYWDFVFGITNTGYLNWTVQVPSTMNLTELPVFWFVCSNAEDYPTLVKSHYFNITSGPVSTTTSSTSSPTIANALPTSTGPSNSGPSTTAMSGGGLSSGAKIGIGVGVALGVLSFVLALACGYLLYKQRRQRLAPRGEISVVAELPRPGPQITKQYQDVSYHRAAQPMELLGEENNRRYFEMDGRRDGIR